MIEDNSSTKVNLAKARFDKLFSELSKDADEALKLARDTGSNSLRRSAFRTVFAAIEGVTFLLKDQVMALFPVNRKYFSDAEVALLREEAYQLDAKGRAVIRPRFLSVDENFRFALEMYMKAKPVSLELDLNSDGWQAFRTSLNIRHRVTHPREPKDLEVSETDLSQLETAYRWMHAVIGKNMARALLTLGEEYYRLLEKIIPQHAFEKLEVIPEEGCNVLEIKDIELLIKWGLLSVSANIAKLTSNARFILQWRPKRNDEKRSA